jgi:hypothetical protein
MAAWELFTSFLDSLTAKERDALKELTASHRTDLLAARSEEARVRMANDFVKAAKEYLKAAKR